MAEAIHCPSCSTRYRLRPERLRPAIRRARCFSCGGVFPVGDIVARLLAPAEANDFDLGADLESGLESRPGSELGDLPDFQPSDGPPSLTLGDLEGTDAEILEKTLVDTPAALPEAQQAPAPERALETAPAVPPFPPEITETTLSGYTSARDAIDKLFGDAPAQPSGLKITKDSSAMDMEATLTALEATLGGGEMPTPPGEAHWSDEGPTASGHPTEGPQAASSTTVRLSQEDLRAALAVAPQEPSSFRSPEPVPAPEARKAAAPSTPSLSPSDLFPTSLATDAGAELLRLKIGEEIYPGLTMSQIIAWVEEGRILENHLVARQHSENWLEAHKVPGLRPVFERLRRERSGGAPSLDSPVMEIAPKKSLFGGLFGKN
ncbi:zinc-ribbon domain-containing protein [Geothrix sp.]|uniref:zinc-ribbon domain-containing protein n=1 Tax=Geothrix sp. TaxID=1962974 RepID=UPI0025C6A2C2|nr:zinc-ribbon domain-containing protein [Geothrix sp.]